MLQFDLTLKRFSLTVCDSDLILFGQMCDSVGLSMIWAPNPAYRLLAKPFIVNNIMAEEKSRETSDSASNSLLGSFYHEIIRSDSE